MMKQTIVEAQSYSHKRETLARSEQALCNMDDYSWTEEPSMVIDFDDADEDYLFVYNGNESSMSIQTNECEPIMNWKINSLHHTAEVKEINHKCVDFTATSLKGMLFKNHELKSKASLMDQQVPCLDLYGESVLRTSTDMRQQLFTASYPNAVGGNEGCDSLSLDQKMEIAQRKLEDSIRRSQLTRPNFIQLSERMLENEACAALLRDHELNRFKTTK
jgi:hypothetical protein